LTAAHSPQVFPQLSWFHQGMRRENALSDRAKLNKA
jgi:hypothetical protein